MSIITNPQEVAELRAGGQRLAHILHVVEQAVIPGIRTDELNELAFKLVKEGGDTPSLLGYQPPFAKRPYPSVMCVSVNDEVVHGIPSENPIVLKAGDIVGFDLVIGHQGLLTDAAITVPVGEIDDTAKGLIKATRESLMAGISVAHGGARMGDIGYAIEECARRHGFSIVEELCGHAVGRAVHEEPEVPNFGSPGTGPELVPGMVLALEPMLNEGTKDVVLDSDGYTIRTKDGKRSAHFEHTILITEGDAEILTKRT
ncbi:MAG TPA: type I methionyl aminopeptidase [Candidatus Paceibacterota bacterium]